MIRKDLLNSNEKDKRLDARHPPKLDLKSLSPCTSSDNSFDDDHVDAVPDETESRPSLTTKEAF